MSFYLISLIWISVGGLAVAAYVWLQDQARRGIVQRTVGGGSDAASIRHRILRPAPKTMGNTIGEKVLQRAPSVWSESASIRQQLTYAGYDSSLAPAIYSTARVFTLVLVPVAAIVLLRGGTAFQMFVLAIGGAFVGLVLPVFLLSRRVGRRQDKIRRSLPDALDLLVVCVEAGISLDAAILRVARDLVYAHPELARELIIVNRKTNAGVTREQALRGLWDRTGVEELRTLVSSLVQSEKWGTSSSRVLRISSETLRRKRRHNAEKRAATAPIKMVIPMALLIFPALFIVILGPAVLRIVKVFGGK
jgi:tight adherence protein C